MPKIEIEVDSLSELHAVMNLCSLMLHNKGYNSDDVEIKMIHKIMDKSSEEMTQWIRSTLENSPKNKGKRNHD